MKKILFLLLTFVSFTACRHIAPVTCQKVVHRLVCSDKRQPGEIKYVDRKNDTILDKVTKTYPDGHQFTMTIYDTGDYLPHATEGNIHVRRNDTSIWVARDDSVAYSLQNQYKEMLLHVSFMSVNAGG